MNQLIQIFATFFKIGAFTFGGGYAMIPLIQREAAERKGWVSDEDILEIVAIAESTPGPIAINAATFVGYRVAGVWGAACATMGVVLPSFVTVLFVFYLLQEYQYIPVVQYAFSGIRAGVLALILKALWGMFCKCEKSGLAYCMMIGVFLAVVVFDFSVVWVLIFCALVGLAGVNVVRRAAE